MIVLYVFQSGQLIDKMADEKEKLGMRIKLRCYHVTFFIVFLIQLGIIVFDLSLLYDQNCLRECSLISSWFFIVNIVILVVDISAICAISQPWYADDLRKKDKPLVDEKSD